LPGVGPGGGVAFSVGVEKGTVRRFTAKIRDKTEYPSGRPQSSKGGGWAKKTGAIRRANSGKSLQKRVPKKENTRFKKKNIMCLSDRRWGRTLGFEGNRHPERETNGKTQ